MFAQVIYQIHIPLSTKKCIFFIFYKNRWFNIIGQLKDYGIYFYCNIATPSLIDNKIIKYIDYDLDLRIFPDNSFKVLDKNEYKYHKMTMKYSDEIDIIVQDSLNKLIKMKENNEPPFQKDLIEKYYKMYKEIVENEK